MSSAQLVDDVLAEILLRLPPVSVLRCRAVCKHWRRITTCPTFVAAYSRRRPPQLLAFPYGFRVLQGSTHELAALDPAAGAAADATCCRRLLRFRYPLRLADSCDGLLLFARDQRDFLICNPATRQWSWLPSPAPWPCPCVLPSGLYFHPPSGEHRLLCIGFPPLSGNKFRKLPAPDAAAVAAYSYYILSTAAGEPRWLGPVAKGDSNMFPSASVTLGGALHWSEHPEAGGTGKIVAFDTSAEAFRLIAAPPSVGPLTHRLRVFDMGGALAVSAVQEPWRRMDVWALEDAAGELWARRLRIDLPPPPPPPRSPYLYPWQWHEVCEAMAVLDDGGAVVVACGSGWVALYDVEKQRTASRVDHGARIGGVSQCLYRKSLVPLPQPDARPCPRDGRGHDGDGRQLLRFSSAADASKPFRRDPSERWIVSSG